MMVGAVNPSFNIEDVHRHVLDAVVEEFKLTTLTVEDRESIWRKWHALDTWPEVPPALVRLKTKYVLVSFTILSTSLVVDVSRRNELTWDCIVSCEMIGTYKTQPQAYRTCAQWLGYRPMNFSWSPATISTSSRRGPRATTALSCTVRRSGVLPARQIQCPTQRTTSSRKISPTWPHSSARDGTRLHQRAATHDYLMSRAIRCLFLQ
jgi:hypothetical protein